MNSFIFTVEIASGGNAQPSIITRPLTPIPSAASSSSSAVAASSKSGNDNGSPAGEPSSSSLAHGRPPSPVLPRRKSAGQALRTASCPTGGDRGGTGAQSLSLSASGRRISLNRRGSGYVDEKEAHRKKSLTWSESDVNHSSSSSKGSRQSSSEKGQQDKPLLTAGSDRKRKQSRKSFDNIVETTVER